MTEYGTSPGPSGGAFARPVPRALNRAAISWKTSAVLPSASIKVPWRAKALAKGTDRSPARWAKISKLVYERVETRSWRFAFWALGSTEGPPSLHGQAVEVRARVFQVKNCELMGSNRVRGGTGYFVSPEKARRTCREDTEAPDS